MSKKGNAYNACTCTYLQSLINCMEIPLERAGGYASKDRKEYT